MNTIVYIRTTGIYSDSRATKEINDLANSGMNVIVLGWDRYGDAYSRCKKVFQQPNIAFAFYDKSTPNGIGLRNIGKLIGWFRWVRKQLFGIQKYDIVHICDLDSGIGVMNYVKRKKVPIVYDVFDYYIDSHNIPKMLEPIVEKLEIELINSATVTIICTEERIEQIKKATPQKLIVLHNSPDIDDYDVISSEFDYVYCGCLDEGRLIKEILERYQTNDDLNFCFAGLGENRELTIQLSNMYKRFSYQGSIPYSEVIEIEKKSKCMSAIYDPSYRNHRLCAPNKFYEAMALGKPVIVCRGTGIDQIVEKNRTGLVIDYDADEFYNAVRYLVNSPEESRMMGENGKKIFTEKYNWNIMRGRLIGAYMDIIEAYIHNK